MPFVPKINTPKKELIYQLGFNDATRSQLFNQELLFGVMNTGARIFETYAQMRAFSRASRGGNNFFNFGNIFGDVNMNNRRGGYDRFDDPWGGRGYDRYGDPWGGEYGGRGGGYGDPWGGGYGGRWGGYVHSHPHSHRYPPFLRDYWSI